MTGHERIGPADPTPIPTPFTDILNHADRSILLLCVGLVVIVLLSLFVMAGRRS